VSAALAWTLGALLVLAGLAVVQRRRGGAVRGEAIQLVASRYLGGKRFLTVVEVEGQRLLIGLAGDRVSLVARLSGGAATAGERA
jgi:flagellar biogenesis protein FliO